MKNEYALCDYINESLIGTSNKAIFLDRDGTIHVDKVRTHLVKDLEYFDDTFSSIKKLYDMGYLIIIVTNQDGIANGLYGKEEMSIFNKQIIDDFSMNGIQIAAIYYSPYKREDNHISFKPNSGMLLQAINDFNLNKVLCYMIGDQINDAISASNLGIKTCIVKTGIYKKTIGNNDVKSVGLVGLTNNLTEAIDLIINDIK